MHFRLRCLLLVAAWVPARAEILDRIAATVDNYVITESDLREHIRIAAFLNGEAPRMDGAPLRKATERLVEQALIRREMEISRYPTPGLADADQLLQQIQEARFPEETAFQEALRNYGIHRDELRQNLLLQLTTLRFIEVRFRPGVAVSESEIEEYHRQTILPQWQAKNGAPPSLEDSRDQIEKILTEKRVDEALDEWLKQARAQSRVRFREEVFE